MRKYDRERRRNRKGVIALVVEEEEALPTKKRTHTQQEWHIPTEDEIFEVSWEDGLYYDCKVIDFIQVDTKMYYDIQFIEDDVIIENVDARKVYKALDCRKLPKRVCKIDGK